ncbi:hypothetical protein ASG31_08470 [Chryseobacterium sp. Leaf404]|uniref:hypothetical protein n=1 Tax=unclassified Chryseobacterium TaxID=2593645 RepID=UPI0006F7DDCE|nr:MULTISPECIES: hypothetical protein [unclassified Chryseobacterium]KQT17435.1 hypothetical protein ASG31_08470 [Chryseobacterium sp. Leaf404]
MWYKLNAQKLILQAWVSFLRKPVIGSFLSLVSDEITDLNNIFNISRTANITKITHNSQVCKLRKILNDTFDDQRRITIVDGVLKKPVYIYTDAEQKPEWLGELIIYTSEETEGNGIDFTVIIPGELKNYQIEIKALVDFYKLAGKRYKIEVDETI